MAPLTGGIIGHQERCWRVRCFPSSEREKELLGSPTCCRAVLVLILCGQMFEVSSKKSVKNKVQSTALFALLRFHQICYFSLASDRLIRRLLMKRPFLAVPLFIDLKRQLHLTGKYFSPTSISTFLLAFLLLPLFDLAIITATIYIFVDLALLLCLPLCSLRYVCVSAHYIFIHWP